MVESVLKVCMGRTGRQRGKEKGYERLGGCWSVGGQALSQQTSGMVVFQGDEAA